MKKIIECIPNFSEGRNQSVIEAIIQAILSVPEIILLDQESDTSHNRSVITFAGEPEKVIEAAFAGTKKAAELIDLNKHRGEHPRMGATDVIPFVPISGVSDEECIKYAEKLGARIGKELNIPVYLYEKAARKKERENLADIRKGEYEGIKKEITKNKDRAPDFGPKKLGKAGATAVGVRAPLIAYNVNLNTKDLKIAKAIAKTVRFKNGGFKHVKALGFELADKGIVQVSMNLTNYKESSIHHVFEAIKRETKRYGVQILESELIGLIPREALIQSAVYYLQLEKFKEDQILENILEKKIAQINPSLEKFLETVASKKPIPGGGSVSALAGTLAATLGSMVSNLTLTGKKYQKSHTIVKKCLKQTEVLGQELFTLINKDASAYNQVVKAFKIENEKKRKIEIQKALKGAALTPLEIAKLTLNLLNPLLILTEHGNPNAISDCGVALEMAKAAIRGAILNIRVNLKNISDTKFNKEMLVAYTKIEMQLNIRARKIEDIIAKKL